MIALAARGGRNGYRGGGHALSARRRGARHARARDHHASPGRPAHLDPGGRDPGPESPQHPPAAAEARGHSGAGSRTTSAATTHLAIALAAEAAAILAFLQLVPRSHLVKRIVSGSPDIDGR